MASHGALEPTWMWRLGRAIGSSSKAPIGMMAMPRVSSNRGMLEPQTLQNQCAKRLASGKRYFAKSSSPCTKRRPVSGKKRLVALALPRTLRHREQWQWVTPRGVSLISNRMPPQRQLPFTGVMGEA